MRIKNLQHKLNNINTNHKKIITKLPLDIDVLDTKYISDNILKHINWNYKTNIIKYNNKPQIYINSNNKVSNKKLNELVGIIIKVKKLLKNNKPVYINLFLTDEKKRLDFNKNEIGPNEVNSGSSIYNLYDNENGKIFIWRKEELNKVLIHELLHAFRLDMNSTNRLSEGHIEAIAVLLKTLIENKNYMKKLNDELQHFKKQMNKIMYYINKNKPTITTHVKQYYFDKAYILSYPKDFMKYLSKNNFKYNENEYVDLLNKNHNRWDYRIKPRRGTRLNMTLL